MSAFCPNYGVVPNAAGTIGDRMGVGENIRAAVMAAYAQTLDQQQFDRTKRLILSSAALSYLSAGEWRYYQRMIHVIEALFRMELPAVGHLSER